MNNIEQKDLDSLKQAHDAYTKYPIGSKMRQIKLEKYHNQLNLYGGKYHAEPYQLGILAGID